MAIRNRLMSVRLAPRLHWCWWCQLPNPRPLAWWVWIRDWWNWLSKALNISDCLRLIMCAYSSENTNLFVHQFIRILLCLFIILDLIFEFRGAHQLSIARLKVEVKISKQTFWNLFVFFSSPTLRLAQTFCCSVNSPVSFFPHNILRFAAVSI